MKKKILITCLLTACVFTFSSCSFQTVSEEITYGDIKEDDDDCFGSVGADDEAKLDIGSEQEEIIVPEEGSEENIDENTEEAEQTEPEDTSKESVASYSSFSYYKNQLNDVQARIYDEILDGCKNFQDEIPLSGGSMDDFYIAETALVYDHPEFFWAQSYIIYSQGEDVSMVKYTVPDGARQISLDIETAAKDVVKGLYGSDYDKVKEIYTWIVDNVTYNVYAENSQDLRSSLLNKESVCAGYAKAFQYMCGMTGIDCTYVSGVANGELHAWNLVKLGEEYYWVDCTFGDPVYIDGSENDAVLYDYLCITDEELFKDHIIYGNVDAGDYVLEGVFSYPECVDMSLDYYVLGGNYFDSFNVQEIASYIVSQVDCGNTDNIEVKFSNDSAYVDCIRDISGDAKLLYGAVNDILNTPYSLWSYINYDNKDLISFDLSELFE